MSRKGKFTLRFSSPCLTAGCRCLWRNVQQPGGFVFDESDYKVEQNIYGDIVETDKHGNTRRYRVEKRADGSTRVYEDPTVSLRMVKSPFKSKYRAPLPAEENFRFYRGFFIAFGIFTAIGFILNWWSFITFVFFAMASFGLYLMISSYLHWKSEGMSFTAAEMRRLFYLVITGGLTIIGITRHWNSYIILIMV